ncbi:fatty acid desaturase [Bordetella sp. 2513F-2]
MEHTQTSPTRPVDAAALRGLMARSDGAGLRRAASHLGAIALVGWAIAAVQARYGLMWSLPLVLLQAPLVAFLFMPVHECAHKTVFRTRWLNVALGNLAAAAIVLPYEYYSLFHWDHHRYTQDPERDPELVGVRLPATPSGLALAFTGVVQLANRIRLHLRHALTGRVTAPWIPPEKRGMIVREARLYFALYALLAIASVAAQSALLVWTWLVPLVLGQLLLRPYLYAEHTGCGRGRSAYDNTRTTCTNALMRWLAWNMPYHVEHHAYPAVPFHALPRLHVLVAPHIQHYGQGYTRVTRTAWRWFREAARGDSA